MLMSGTRVFVAYDRGVEGCVLIFSWVLQKYNSLLNNHQLENVGKGEATATQ